MTAHAEVRQHTYDEISDALDLLRDGFFHYRGAREAYETEKHNLEHQRDYRECLARFKAAWRVMKMTMSDANQGRRL